MVVGVRKIKKMKKKNKEKKRMIGYREGRRRSF